MDAGPRKATGRVLCVRGEERKKEKKKCFVEASHFGESYSFPSLPFFSLPFSSLPFPSASVVIALSDLDLWTLLLTHPETKYELYPFPFPLFKYKLCPHILYPGLYILDVLCVALYWQFFGMFAPHTRPRWVACSCMVRFRDDTRE